FYDGEGPSLAMWNGESYQFSDGDHDLYRGEDDSLGGYTAEWLTHRELERRLFCSQQIVKMKPDATVVATAFRDRLINGLASLEDCYISRESIEAAAEDVLHSFTALAAPATQEPVAFLCRECDEEGWSTYAVMP